MEMLYVIIDKLEKCKKKVENQIRKEIVVCKNNSTWQKSIKLITVSELTRNETNQIKVTPISSVIHEICEICKHNTLR